MFNRRWIAAAVLGAALGAAAQPAPGLAKPPGLPVDNRIECPEGREGCGNHPGLDLFGRVEVEVNAGRSLSIDVVSPALVPALVQRLVQSATEGAVESLDARTRRLFEEGDHLRARGNNDAARSRYQEAHLLGPTTHFGQRAIQRLMELENQVVPVGFTEEQEAPARPEETPKRESRDEQMLRRLRATTQPLGTVEVDSY